MRKIIAAATGCIIALTTVTGLLAGRNVHAMIIRMNVKDLPEHGLRLISPSDPSFDGKLAVWQQGQANDVVDKLKPISVFMENESQKTVVAYVIEWCFTKADGRSDCYRKAVSNPRALMDGEDLPPGLADRAGKITPNSARFFSLLDPDGSGSLRVPVTPAEAEQIRRGTKRLDQAELLERFTEQLAQYSAITVSIDGAFFDDGSFVGPDASGFFALTNAEIEAKSDLLNEIQAKLSSPGVSKAEVLTQVEAIASQPDISLDVHSTPADYYHYYKKFYANEVLQRSRIHGPDRGLAAALQPLNKPWHLLHKKR